MDKNFNILEFGKTDKFIILSNDIELIENEISYLKSKFTYGKIIYITSSYNKYLPKEQIVLKNLTALKKTFKNTFFNAAYVFGFEFNDVQQYLTKRRKRNNSFLISYLIF